MVLANSRVELERYRQWRAEAGVRGPKPGGVLEVVIRCPVPIEQVPEFAEKSVQWVARALGKKSRIASASIHYDESTPHVHVFAIPYGRRAQDLGFTRAQAMSPIGDGKLRGKFWLGAAQQDFYEHVGRGYGLTRPQKSSGRDAPLDRNKSASSRAAYESAAQERRPRATAHRDRAATA